MREAPDTPGPRPPTPDGAGRVYIIDDDRVIRELLGGQVEHLGLIAVQVPPFRSAIAEVIAEADASDTIILDIILGPDLDGFEVVRMLSNAAFRGRLVAISGFGQDYLQSIGALATALDIRVASTLAKPVRLIDLAQCLLRGDPE